MATEQEIGAKRKGKRTDKSIIRGMDSRPLAERKKRAGGVRRRDESRPSFDSRMQGDPNADIDAIFRGIQSTRGPLRRGFSGQPLNPDGTDPGNSFDRFMKQNPHLGGAASRQAENDKIAKANFPGNVSSALAEKRAMQEMQNFNPNMSTQADGFRTITDGRGQVIGTNRPVVNSGIDQGLMNKGQGLASDSPKLRSAMTQGALGAGKASGIDRLFGGGKVSPSGESSSRMVGAGQAPGAPGGDLFGQVPGFKSEGMQGRSAPMGANMGPQTPAWMNPGPELPVETGPVMPKMGVNSGPINSPNDTPQDWTAQSRAKSFPQGQMQAYQPPYSSPEQLAALSVLKQLFGSQNAFSAGLESNMQNMFPGQDDWAFLKQLFPGLVQDNVGAVPNMRALSKLYQDPVYQSRF